MKSRIPTWMLILPCSLMLIFAISLPIHAAKSSIAVAWKTPVRQPLSLSMSAGGQYCGIVEQGGVVKIFGPNGKPLWRQTVKGATDVLVARNGQSVLVYSRLNPVYQEVNFFRMNGTKLWTHRIDGCVWSGAVSADGMRAVVTTGEKYVYLYEPDPHRPKYRRWRIQGIGYKAMFTPDNQRVVIGTFQKPMLISYNLNGKMLWSTKSDSERQYELHISADANSIVGTLPGTRNNPGGELKFWNSGGRMMWSREIEGFDTNALVSPQSRYTAVSYADARPSRKGKEIVERKVAVYQSDGKLLWQKGGLFFGPHLIALSPTGSSVIVSDGAKSVYNINEQGRILSKMNMNGTIREAMSTDDGRRLLIYCGDGWLYLMDVG